MQEMRHEADEIFFDCVVSLCPRLRKATSRSKTVKSQLQSDGEAQPISRRQPLNTKAPPFTHLFEECAHLQAK
ncbi:hypothetical protein EYF80_010103 [Liparis tanakae]|uniref:Uncharacterized protein n=1 Tax=Liparis tanakae TaxID=230148 RepID=A0A4Z2INX8_9TELE|nr:hypothetical protein EYF80_010103 [Liparis tanakae]